MESVSQIVAKLLAEPFDSNSVEWRIQSAGLNKGAPWALAIPYLTARAVQQRLDDVVGIDGWENKFQAGADGGVICVLKLKINGQWVSKSDGSENTNIEPVKGGLSDAMKRAAVQFGIGRYLYRLQTYFAVCHTDQYAGQHRQKFVDKWDKEAKPVFGSWDEPQLPDFALPFHAQKVKCDQFIKLIHDAPNMKQLQIQFTSAYKWADKEMKNVEFAKRLERAKDTAKNDLRVKEMRENKS